MTGRSFSLFVVEVFMLPLLFACGLYVPVKGELRGDEPTPAQPRYTQQGDYENQIVSHIACEIANGLRQAEEQFKLPWLANWGTAVTLTITSEDQSGINAGGSIIDPMHNVLTNFPVGGTVTSPQSFMLGMGASGAATATRTETIQFTYLNSDLITFAENYPSCTSYVTGSQIDGDLKIRQFIFDKAMIARLGNASLYDKRSIGFKASKFKRPDLPWEWPVFNTFTEEITFLAAYGGNITPTWKLARVTANSSGNLLSAERTSTNDLIITLGPVSPPTQTAAASLSPTAQAQHNARVQASAIATSIQAQSQQ